MRIKHQRRSQRNGSDVAFSWLRLAIALFVCGCVALVIRNPLHAAPLGRETGEGIAQEMVAPVGGVLQNVRMAQATATPEPNQDQTGRVPVIRQPPDSANLLQGSLGIMTGSTAGGKTGVVIQIFDGNKLLGEVTADNQAIWAFPLPDLAPGAHTLTAWQKDENGNPLISTPVTIVVKPSSTNPERPTIELADKTAVFTPESKIELQGKSTPDVALQIIERVTLYGEVKTDAQGNWTFTLPRLKAGAHTIAARQLDKNNTPIAVSIPLDFTVASAEGTNLTIGKPAGGVLTAGDTLSGMGTVGATVTIATNGEALGTAVVGENGFWSFVLPENVPVGIVEFQVTQEAPSATTSVLIEVRGATLPGTGMAQPIDMASLLLIAVSGVFLCVLGMSVLRKSSRRRS